MSIRGLDWQTHPMRFVAGMNTGNDPRALESPELLIARDLQFDERGGIQTRYPFGAEKSSIIGGGTISNARRVVENGDEKLLFTKDAVYSWNEQQAKWALRGTHLAVKVDEEPRFVSTGEQVCCDRAELSGTIIYAWTEIVGSSSTVYVAAVDKATGSVVMSPTTVAGVVSDGAKRPRLVALSTKILLFYIDDTISPDLMVKALDPASPSTGLAAGPTTVLSSSSGMDAYYDATRVIGLDKAVVVARRSPSTDYEIATVTGGLVVTQSTKARTCDGPIAVSCTPDGASAQVIRSVDGGGGLSTDIKGDLITISSLADTAHINKAVGTTATGPTNLDQIAAAHRSVQDSSQYRCYAFWSSGENEDPSDWSTKYNWVDTGGNLGTQATFVRRLGLASRAFDYDGRVYVWGVFAGASGSGFRSFRSSVQNSYFLYRDDAFLANAKAAYQRAGGFVHEVSCLPGVALTDGATTFSWCGTERRIIQTGPNATSYADRGPRDITFTFDSNEARRCARLGRTLYITGGEIIQYDGRQLVEVGFHVFPWNIQPVTNGAGNLEAGTYAYQVTQRWDNAVGELDRSTTATTATVDISPGPNKIAAGQFPNLHITHKTSPAIAVEIWRTKKDPLDDSPLYLTTSKDPTDTSNPNRYIPNDPTANLVPAFDDDFADADLANLEQHPENGGVLENIAPPGATLIIATDTRLFLGGIVGDPDRVWYSKQRAAGQVAAFHDALALDVPPAGGAMTGLVWHLGVLYVFRETATYAFPGEGFGNVGGVDGSRNFGPVDTISENVGATNQESIAVTDKSIAFHSSKGKWLLNGRALEPIGVPAADFDSETPIAVQVMESQHQIRWLTSSRMLVLDVLGGQWFEWTIDDGVHACMWNGAHAYLTSTGVKVQESTHTLTDYGIDLETAPIKFNDLAGYGAMDCFHLLGEFVSSCTVRIRLALDYATTYFQDKTHTPSQSTGTTYELKHSPSIRQAKSYRVRITVAPTSAGESVKLTGINFLLGVQPGLNRNLAQANKQ